MCAANNKHPERKHFVLFFLCSLDICQAKQIEFAARSPQLTARSSLPFDASCNRIEIKIRNPPESPVIVIDAAAAAHAPLSLPSADRVGKETENGKLKKGKRRTINPKK